MGAVKHYGKDYFSWQKKVGEFGGKANLFKFESYIEDDMDVLDFGAGGGICLIVLKPRAEKWGLRSIPMQEKKP